MKADIYQTVTDSIIGMLEAGVRPWAPGHNAKACGLPVIPTRACGTAYRGINVALLWGAAEMKGYRHHTWMTFNQAKALGGCVRKGEKATPIVYWGTFKAQVDDADEGDDGKARLFAKAYSVFNVEQIDGLPARFFEPATLEPSETRIAKADAWAVATGADIRHGGSQAFYSPKSDHVQMPPLEAFYEPEAYYGTLAHELTHWSGAKARLDRQFGKRFGDKAYAFEELIAEMGAAFAMARLGIAAEPREDHASYLASWLKVLKADKRAIFTAASKAQAACDFLFDLADKAPEKTVERPCVQAMPANVIYLPDLSGASVGATTGDDDTDPTPPKGSKRIVRRKRIVSFGFRAKALARSVEPENASGTDEQVMDARPRVLRKVRNHAAIRLAHVGVRKKLHVDRKAGAVADTPRHDVGGTASGDVSENFNAAIEQPRGGDKLASGAFMTGGEIHAPIYPAAPSRPFHPRRDPSLCEFLSIRGICDDGGELRGRDLDRWHREAPFRRRLVRADGVSLETAARQAWEAGYFDDVAVPTMDSSDNMHPVTPEMLIAAMDRELRDDYAHVWGAHDAEFFA